MLLGPRALTFLDQFLSRQPMMPGGSLIIHVYRDIQQFLFLNKEDSKRNTGQHTGPAVCTQFNSLALRICPSSCVVMDGPLYLSELQNCLFPLNNEVIKLDQGLKIYIFLAVQ